MENYENNKTKLHHNNVLRCREIRVENRTKIKKKKLNYKRAEKVNDMKRELCVCVVFFLPLNSSSFYFPAKFLKGKWIAKRKHWLLPFGPVRPFCSHLHDIYCFDLLGSVCTAQHIHAYSFFFFCWHFHVFYYFDVFPLFSLSLFALLFGCALLPILT